MKTLLFAFTLLFAAGTLKAQNDTLNLQDSTTYRFIKTDGGELMGKIISQDPREILILSTDNRQIYLPQHVVKEIIVVKASDFNSQGTYVGEDKFATRYFLSTNGLPVKKGEHYIQWNLFGPNLQFGLDDNLGIGLMTSWGGVPIIGTIKKSWELSEKTQFALGALVGTGSWAAIDLGGAIPFASLSFGDRRANLALSGGYGAFWLEGPVENRSITSIAGMAKISPKISLVFDSFILLPSENRNSFALIIPGIRWHQSEGKAVQFGFAGLVDNGKALPFPVPMVQWYRRL